MNAVRCLFSQGTYIESVLLSVFVNQIIVSVCDGHVTPHAPDAAAQSRTD